MISNQGQLSDSQNMRTEARYTTTFLVSTSGYPEDWNSSNVEIPGFAIEDNILDAGKLREFRDISYEDQSLLLRAKNFNLTFFSDGQISELGAKQLSFGKKVERNSSTVVSIQRDILIEGIEGDRKNGLIHARNSSSEIKTSHYVNFSIGPDSDTAGNSLNQMKIIYPQGTVNLSNVDERNDILTVGIDEDRDGEIEVNVREDPDDLECCPPDDGVITSDQESTLELHFTGNYNLNNGDSLIVEYDEVINPESGNYTVSADLNGDVVDSGQLSIYDSYDGQYTSLQNQKMKFIVWENE